MARHKCSCLRTRRSAVRARIDLSRSIFGGMDKTASRESRSWLCQAAPRGGKVAVTRPSYVTVEEEWGVQMRFREQLERRVCRPRRRPRPPRRLLPQLGRPLHRLQTLRDRPPIPRRLHRIATAALAQLTRIGRESPAGWVSDSGCCQGEYPRPALENHAIACGGGLRLGLRVLSAGRGLIGLIFQNITRLAVQGFADRVHGG